MKTWNFLWALVAIAAIAAATWRWYPAILPARLAHQLPASPGLGPPLYKWRDAKGRLNVTSTAPADRPYEVVRYDPNTNVVPGKTP
jgi:hypothetical protein